MSHVKKHLAYLLITLFFPCLASATILDWHIPESPGGVAVFDLGDCSFGEGYTVCDIDKTFGAIDEIVIYFIVEGAGSLYLDEFVVKTKTE